MMPTGAKKNAPAPNSQLSTFTSASLTRLAGRHPLAAARTAVHRAGALVLHVRLAVQVVQDRLVGRRLVPLGDLRVVQVEGWPLGPDPRDRREVVPRGRAGGGPLQGGTVTPRVVDLDQRRRPPGLPHVVEERQGRGAEQEGADGGDLVLH